MKFSRRALQYCVAIACGAAATILAAPGSARADILAAELTITGTDDATSVATVVRQTPGPTLHAGEDPAMNLGDISLSLGDTRDPITQAGGVLLATPYQFQWAAVGDRNMVEAPGELTPGAPGGFPAGIWLSTTKVSGAGSEANFNLTLDYFPFADGWTAGHVKNDGSFLAGNTTGVSVTYVQDGRYTLSIADTDSRNSGMLFAMSSENSSSGNVVPVGILPDGAGWDVRVNDQGLNFPATEAADWAFVYVPYGAKDLIGGRLRLPGFADAGPAEILNQVGNFSVSRVDIGNNASASIMPPPGDGIDDVGRFLITIPGKTNEDGHLVLGISKYAESGSNLGADDNFLTYEYRSELGGWVVETYDLTGATLQNSDIYFAFLDYDGPIEVPEPGALALAFIGLGLLAFCRRSKA